MTPVPSVHPHFHRLVTTIRRNPMISRSTMEACREEIIRKMWTKIPII